MKKFLLYLLIGLLSFSAKQPQEEKAEASQLPEVYIIPMAVKINKAQLYILRRGLKQAVESKVENGGIKNRHAWREVKNDPRDNGGFRRFQWEDDSAC